MEPSKAVFLSYASEDTENAARICEGLRSAGIEVWFDRSELRGGDVWDQSIRRNIKDCALFLPVISANTNARAEGYFRLEWKLAVDRSHLMSGERAFLLPVVIDDTTDGHAVVPDRFREVQWSHLPEGRVPAAFVELVSRLLEPAGKLSGMSALQVPPPAAAPAGWHSLPRRRVLGAAVAAAAGAAVLGISGGWWWSSKGGSAGGFVPAVVGVPAVAGAADARSIAVLPFVNLSSDKEQEYFSDGISEELLSVLQKIPGLHVAARMSAFSFKGTTATVQEIGVRLGVANVIEGSVRKAGNMVRISARLSRAATGDRPGPTATPAI